MESLNVGIIGCGNMGQSHISNIADTDLLSIVAVSDPVAENAEEAATMAGNVAKFGDYSELLEREDVNAVIVATPNFLHREVTIAALEAGKDVLCEKPMALSSADCDAMWDTAQRLGRKLMAGQVLRLMHPFVDLRALIASGEVGEPRSANIDRINSSWIFGFAKSEHWRLSRDKTGGLLFEINAHEMDLLRCILGEPIQVFARSVNLLDARHDYEDSNMLLIDFEGGNTACFYGSSASGINHTGGVFFCTKGTVRYEWNFRGETVLEYKRFDDEEATRVDVPDDHKIGLRTQAESFAKWVMDGQEPDVTGWDGRQAVAMAEAAYESARQNTPVKVK